MPLYIKYKYYCNYFSFKTHASFVSGTYFIEVFVYWYPPGTPPTTSGGGKIIRVSGSAADSQYVCR